MGAIELEDIVLTSVVTCLAAYQLTRFARRVGQARLKHKVPYPQMAGDPNFERTLRAQQNCLEFFPVFMTFLWMSTLFVHQVPSALLGLVYMYSRELYFKGYCRDVQERLPGFRLGVRCLLSLLALTVLGILAVLLRMYAGLDFVPYFRYHIMRYVEKVF